MATATMAEQGVKVVSARVIKRRVSARLVLSIDGIEHEVWPFEDEYVSRSSEEWAHVLKGEDGRSFRVYPMSWVDGVKPEERFRCTRCGHGHCRHIEALDLVNLV